MVKKVFDWTAKIQLCLFSIKKKYPNKRKGIFMANDTHANILINLLMREYGSFPDEYRIVGFDDSPIASDL